MIELFSLGFILVFTLFLIVLVCLNINVMLNKGNTNKSKDQDNMSYFTNWWKTYVNKEMEIDDNIDRGSKQLGLIREVCANKENIQKNYELETDHAPNSVQEKWKEYIPNHKTRVSLRKKRKKKEK